jgi:hypothetical protein
MRHDIFTSDKISGELPRRLKMSSREIGAALALTFAAATQLIAALTSKEQRLSGPETTLDPINVIKVRQ